MENDDPTIDTTVESPDEETELAAWEMIHRIASQQIAKMEKGPSVPENTEKPKFKINIPKNVTK